MEVRIEELGDDVTKCRGGDKSIGHARPIGAHFRLPNRDITDNDMIYLLTIAAFEYRVLTMLAYSRAYPRSRCCSS
jgi:hypothetical protein